MAPNRSRARPETTSFSRPLPQKGFSLIEVMVAMGVAAVLTYALSQMLVNSGKQAATITSKGDFNSFTNQLQGVFNNTKTCLSAVSKPDGTPTAIPDPTDTPDHLKTMYPLAAPLTFGGVTYTTNSKIGPATSKKSLTIKTMEFGTPYAAGGASATANKNQFVMPLSISVDRGATGLTDGNVAGANLLSKTYSLIVTLENPNPDPTKKTPRKILACAGQYTDFWSTTGDTGQDIVYTGGKVAIGDCSKGQADVTCVDPPNAPLDVGGAIQAAAFMYRSDARLKENVREIPDALARVLQLRGVLFDWKNASVGTDQLGLIAQEVERVFPEAVSTAPNGMKSVSYANLMAPLVEAFKEQKQVIQRQDREIEELKEAVRRKRSGT